MSSTAIIALAALGVAVLTYITTTVGARRTDSRSYVEQLERRVAELEDKVERQEHEIENLKDENLRLLKRVVG